MIFELPEIKNKKYFKDLTGDQLLGMIGEKIWDVASALTKDEKQQLQDSFHLIETYADLLLWIENTKNIWDSEISMELKGNPFIISNLIAFFVIKWQFENIREDVLNGIVG